MKIALLIVDMQPVHVQGQVDERKINRACEYINYVAGQLRSKNQVVIHVQDVEGMTEDNRELYAVIPEVPVYDSDLRVAKESGNAFWNTELEQVLARHGVRLVIIAGFAAEQCVLFTYNGAEERGFRPVILQNGVLSTHSDAVDATYRDRNVISYPVVEFLI